MSDQTIPDGLYGYPVRLPDGRTAWIYAPPGITPAQVAAAVEARP